MNQILGFVVIHRAVNIIIIYYTAHLGVLGLLMFKCKIFISKYIYYLKCYGWCNCKLINTILLNLRNFWSTA